MWIFYLVAQAGTWNPPASVSQVAGILNHHTLLDEVLIGDILVIICIYIIKKVHCGLDI